MIRVHTQVGEKDNGVRCAGGEVVADRAVGVDALLGMVLCRTKDLCSACGILAGAVCDLPAAAFGDRIEGFIPDDVAMWR